MFYYYQAYSLKKLADYFVESISHKGHPFKQTWVVVQNNEVKEWLSLAIAEKTGIAANFKFIYPSELIWTLYRLGENELAETLPDDKNAMLWGLFSLLHEKPELLATIPFLNAKKSEKQLFQFCSQLADVFDQYQVYRPHMLENWLSGSHTTQQADEAWQAGLYRQLNERITKHHGTKYPRRSEIIHSLIKRFKENDLHQDYPDRIYVFGLSHLSKPLLEVLTVLSLKADIHFYTTSVPQFENAFAPLAAKWAKPKTEQLNLLKQLLEQYNAQDDTNLCDEALPLAKTHIHSCHNKRREVEVLKDEILRFLHHNPDKTADDVLVLVPDADAYSGLIESVFSQSKELKLPVSAFGMKNRQAVAYSLETLVNLLGSTFKANDVMQLLHLKPVSDTLGFSESNLTLIEKWLQDNKVFWGLGEMPADLYSFTKGINQIAAGIAMDVPPLDIYQGLAPYPSVKSVEQIQSWSKFSYFVNKLKEANTFVSQPHRADEWLDFLIQLINDLAGGQEQHIQQKIQLTKNLCKIQEQVQLAGSEVAVPFEIIKPWLLAHLDSSGSGAGRFGNGIIISTYVPYRGIPFSFIGMLGINEASFPRKSIRPVFDLMARAPEPGDRILKEDDSLLFLETKLAARQHLHLSYIGHSQQSASMQLPSILVQQLLDSGINAENGIISHGLHPFSRSNFSHGKPPSFLKENVELAMQLQANKTSETPFLHPDFTYTHQDTKAPIQDIITFFQHPAKHFTQRVLDIKNYSEFKVLEEREYFQLDGLNNYNLENFVFQHLAGQQSENSIYAYAAVKPFISEGYAGQNQFQKAKTLAEDLIKAIEKKAIGNERSYSIHLNIGGIEFSGNIAGVYNDALVLYRPGNIRAKHLVELWLKHLFLLEAGIAVSKSYFIGKSDKGVEIVTVQSKNIPTGILHGLVEWFWQNSQLLQKLNFFPDSSKSYAECIFEDKTPAEALNNALKTWDNYSDFCEAKDEFNQLLWRGMQPLQQDAFKHNAEQFWLPLLRVLEKEGV